MSSSALLLPFCAPMARDVQSVQTERMAMGASRNDRDFRAIDLEGLERLKQQISFYHVAATTALAVLGRQEEAERFSEQYYTDLASFAIYVMKLDGYVSPVEERLIKEIIGDALPSNKFLALTYYLSGERLAEFGQSVPESFKALVSLLHESRGTDITDPYAVPGLYLALASFVSCVDGHLDEDEVDGVQDYVMRLTSYVQFVVGSESDSPNSSPRESSMSSETARALLGLGDGPLDAEAIKEAYRNAVQLNHPDRYAGNEKLQKHAEEQCRRINEAREVLIAEIDAPFRRDKDRSSGSDKKQAAGDRRDTSAPSSSGKGRGSSAANHYAQNRERRDPPSGPNWDSSVSLLDTWKTPVGMSVLGILSYVFALPAIDVILNELTVRTQLVDMLFFTLAAEFALYLCKFIYAARVYPSYFTPTPKVKSPKAVAFLNCMLGGIVFGLIWNSNITKRKKGISNIVYATLCVVPMLSRIYLVFSWAAYLSA